MGLFSKKPADSKARIEELKKKIQAEQQAFAQNASQPAAPVTQPGPAPATPQPTAAQQPVAAVPQQNAQPQPAAPQAPARHTYQQQSYQAPPQQQVFYEQPPQQSRHHHASTQLPEDLFEEDESTMEEIKTGIILDLGDGMSLNLPIRSRMRLDEFLRIADRVRELQKAQSHQGQY